MTHEGKQKLQTLMIDVCSRSDLYVDPESVQAIADYVTSLEARVVELETRLDEVEKSEDLYMRLYATADPIGRHMTDYKKLIADAVAKERERCARIAEETHAEEWSDNIAGSDIAAAIRSNTDE